MSTNIAAFALKLRPKSMTINGRDSNPTLASLQEKTDPLRPPLIKLYPDIELKGGMSFCTKGR